MAAPGFGHAGVDFGQPMTQMAGVSASQVSQVPGQSQFTQGSMGGFTQGLGGLSQDSLGASFQNQTQSQ